MISDPHPKRFICGSKDSPFKSAYNVNTRSIEVSCCQFPFFFTLTELGLVHMKSTICEIQDCQDLNIHCLFKKNKNKNVAHSNREVFNPVPGNSLSCRVYLEP